MSNLTNQAVKTYDVTILREIYEDAGFHIYAGTLPNFDEISIKTDGFELCQGPKKLVGIMGKYQDKFSLMCKYEEFDVKSKIAQKNLLMSINGIKEATADLVLSKVDDINIYRTDDYPEIKGIGPAKVILIREGLQLLDNMQIFKEINILLGSECTTRAIKNITEILETIDDGLEKFKKSPYSILIEHVGMGFKKADKIALSMGINKNDNERRKYLIEFIVKSYTRNGNCFIMKDKLIEFLDENNIYYYAECIENNNRLMIENEKVYTSQIFEAETKVPYLLKEINNRKTDIKRLDSYDTEKFIEDYQKLNKIKFDDYQKQAIDMAVNSNISIITGGAGCGKTTLLKCVLEILKTTGHNLFLTAPTGKAARRMSQACELESSTIHRFLIESVDKCGKKNCVMIIDEVSMMDIVLLSDLLESMKYSSLDFVKLILVGDPGQLPSVQPGNVLNDLIESNTLNVVKLIKTFRQSKDSNIIDIATKVRNNQQFDFMKSKDFYVREANNVGQYKETIKYFFNYLKDKYTDIDSFYSEVQFITPLKKGDIGVNTINTMIKNLVNPKKNKKDQFPFDIHDKIMCTRNDKENGIFNGEFGRVTDIDKTTFTVYFKDLGKYVTYKKEFEIINDFILSYCSTVHKLQGSEFKYIILILSNDSFILDSRLLYTAITRGKQTVIMITNKAITNKIVVRNNLLKRNTFLKERMINYFEREF